MGVQCHHVPRVELNLHGEDENECACITESRWPWLLSTTAHVTRGPLVRVTLVASAERAPATTARRFYPNYFADGKHYSTPSSSCFYVR